MLLYVFPVFMVKRVLYFLPLSKPVSIQHWSSPSHTPTPLAVPEDKQSSSYQVTAPSLSPKCMQFSQFSPNQVSHSILLSLQVIDCHDLGDIITDLIISIMDFFDRQFALSCAWPYVSPSIPQNVHRDRVFSGSPLFSDGSLE